MAKSKNKSKSELEDSLANTLADSINKQFKGQALKTAFFLAGDDDSPSNVKEWISSGVSMLDLCRSRVFDGRYDVSVRIFLPSARSFNLQLNSNMRQMNMQKKEFEHVRHIFEAITLAEARFLNNMLGAICNSTVTHFNIKHKQQWE